MEILLTVWSQIFKKQHISTTSTSEKEKKQDIFFQKKGGNVWEEKKLLPIRFLLLFTTKLYTAVVLS